MKLILHECTEEVQKYLSSSRFKVRYLSSSRFKFRNDSLELLNKLRGSKDHFYKVVSEGPLVFGDLTLNSGDIVHGEELRKQILNSDISVVIIKD